MGPAEDFPPWNGLFTGLGRPCIPVAMDCVYVGVKIWHEWWFVQMYVNVLLVKLFV